MTRTFWKAAAALAGAGAGFAYYYYVGCTTGACPITANPWISSAYGALIGWLAVPSAAQRKERDT